MYKIAAKTLEGEMTDLLHREHSFSKRERALGSNLTSAVVIQNQAEEKQRKEVRFKTEVPSPVHLSLIHI